MTWAISVYYIWRYEGYHGVNADFYISYATHELVDNLS